MSASTPNRLVSVGLPIACLFIALGLGGYEYLRKINAHDELLATRTKLAAVQQDLRNVIRDPVMAARFPAALDTKQEDTHYLEQLRQSAQECGVQIVRWVRIDQPKPGTSNGNTTAGPAPDLKGLTPVVSDLEVYGPYESVRAFVRRLENSERLLNMDDVSWHRGQVDGTRLFVKLTRYLSAPGSIVGGDTQHFAQSTVGGMTE